MLGHQNQQQGRYALAAQQQQAAAGLLESIGNLQGLAHTLDNLGSAQQHLDELDDATSNHERAYALADKLGDLAVARRTRSTTSGTSTDAGGSTTPPSSITTGR